MRARSVLLSLCVALGICTLLLGLRRLGSSRRAGGSASLTSSVRLSSGRYAVQDIEDEQDWSELDWGNSLLEEPDMFPVPHDRKMGYPATGAGMPNTLNRNPYRGTEKGPEATGELTTGRIRSGPVLGCEQFRSRNFTWPANIRSIAIVGNGPLTETSRKEIEGMDLVIRFNKLQSYRCGEKFDVWASRHGDSVTTRYWGIGQKLNITGCPLEKLLDLSQHIWLLNGGDAPFHHFLRSYPQINEQGRYVWLDCRRWVKEYMRKYDPQLRMGTGASTQDQVNPSSGWLVMMMVRDCAPRQAKVHVYGFNWPGGQWPAHKVTEEQAEIRDLERRGKLTIHTTQCKDKYSCDKVAAHKVTENA